VLLEAAREVFSEQGFEGATVRTIAARAGVNASMVNHWFGSKQGLVAATIDDLFDVTDVVNGVLAGDPVTLAQQLVRTFVTKWDAHGAQFAAMVRSVSSQEIATTMLRDFLTTRAFRQVARNISPDQAEFRASLCATQIIGMGMMRYVLQLEPLVTASVDKVVTAIAPTVERYLTGDLD
jgi:AcrR family transcriptional regulator